MACETRIDAVIKATVTDLIRAEISGQPEGRVSAQISAVTGRGVKGVALENGEIVFICLWTKTGECQLTYPKPLSRTMTAQ